MDWADFGPKNYYPLLGQTRPRRLGWARIRLAQAKRAGGIISPPPLNAERYSFCMQRRKRKKNKRENEGEEELPGAEAVACCVSGGAVAEAGGGVLAPGRRLQAAAAVLCFF
jgi:hypothetical protein